MLSAWAAHSLFPGSQGSGIPQAIAARHLKDDSVRSGLLSARLTIGKIILTLLGLACGASIGREGPTVQIGASIMLGTAKLGGIGRERGLILAGSAAGVAAAFNTPLAGVVFAIEEMSRAFESRTSGLVLIAVILAGMASLGLVGNYNYFGHSTSRGNAQSDPHRLDRFDKGGMWRPRGFGGSIFCHHRGAGNDRKSAGGWCHDRCSGPC